MKYEIINPSDKATIEGNDFKNVCIATIILGEGKYGLQEINGDKHMPPVIFARGWFLGEFGISEEEAIKSSDIYELKQIFKTVKLVGERSSLNDIEGYAKYLVCEIEDRGHA